MSRRIAIGVALVFALGAVLFSTFSSISVCSRCGSTRSSLEFQIPLTSLSYYRRFTIEDTEMCRMARELVGSHEHQWELIHGSGNGVACEIGMGGDILNNVRSAEVISFVSCTYRFRGRQEARDWLSTALDHKTARALQSWLLVQQFPEKGFDSPNEYEKWRQDADKSWPDLVEESEQRW